jgi:hypothetical protein
VNAEKFLEALEAYIDQKVNEGVERVLDQVVPPDERGISLGYRRDRFDPYEDMRKALLEDSEGV